MNKIVRCFLKPNYLRFTIYYSLSARHNKRAYPSHNGGALAPTHDHPLNDELMREEHTDLEKQDQGYPENASDDTISDIVAGYESRIDDIAELVARVRHEINNPLTGVLGQAQLLLREELSESARKRAETIEGLAIRLRDVVGQLRDVQKTQKK